MPNPLDLLRDVLGPAGSVGRVVSTGPLATSYLLEGNDGETRLAHVLHAGLVAGFNPDRFLSALAEARALSHPNLIPVLGADATEGLAYFVTPGPGGITARDKLDVHGPAPGENVLEIIRAASAGLWHAHDCGVTHLSLAPEHVYLTEAAPALLGVGVKQALEASFEGVPSDLDERTTPPGYALPTAMASAPPPLRDLFQLGALAYELLTARPPRPHDSPGAPATSPQDTAWAAALERGVPDDLAEFVAGCFESDSADRLSRAGRPAFASRRHRYTSAGGPSSVAPGERVGPFELVEVLGRGGMGTVYLAHQKTPVERRVALKIVKLGMDTQDLLERFEREQHALDLMDHRGIASVYGSGTTDSGRPYFVMEFVRGSPIDVYCDEHRLSTSERLKLFVAVCRAVEHAHQKGILHRDLKPANVLVSDRHGVAAPKVIDFGLAKAIAGPMEPGSLTVGGQWVGTPGYMSPEQSSGSADVDTRSDVYSLGVMLYELLTGSLPNTDPTGSGGEADSSFDPAAVPSPSNRVAALGPRADSVAAARQTDPGGLRRQIRGDLDWIVLKALEVDRDARYATVDGLAKDVERHLRHEVVEARAPSLVHRARKFTRRHRLGVAVGLTTALSLVAGLVTTTVQMVRAERAEREAAAAALSAEQVLDLLIGVFSTGNPENLPADSTSLRELLTRGTERLGVELADQPALRTRLMFEMARALQGLGDFSAAAGLLEEALELLDDPTAVDPLLLADVRFLLSSQYGTLGRLADAEAMARLAVQGRERALGPDHEDVLSATSGLAVLMARQGRFAEAEPYFMEILAGMERLNGPDHWTVGLAANRVGLVLFEQGKYDEAEPYLVQGLEVRERALGRDHVDVAGSLNNLGNLYRYRGDYEEAAAVLERSLRIREEAYGPDHAFVAESLFNLGGVYVRLERFEDARAVQERVLSIRTATLGPDHSEVAKVMSVLGMIHMHLGDLDAAERLLTSALPIKEGSLGREHPELVPTLIDLGIVAQSQSDYAQAESYYLRGLSIAEPSLGPHAWTGLLLFSMGALHASTGEFAEAVDWYERALAMQEAVLRPDHPDLVATRSGLVDALRATGNPARADSLQAANSR